MNDVKRFAAQYSTFLILAVLMLMFSVLSSRFMRFSNLLNIVDQSALVAIVAIGVTITIISGGIDLSVGSMVALVGAISAGLIVRSGLPVSVGLLVGLILGAGLGLFNGVLVVVGRLQPFVATLATNG